MAKVLQPLHSAQASGSIAGVQYSRNAAGAFASRKSTSTRADNAGALEYRSMLGSAHHAFDALTDAQRATWAFPDDTAVTARQRFLTLYLAKSARGLTLPIARPSNRGYFAVTELNLARGAPIQDTFTASWLMAAPLPGLVDYVASSSYGSGYDPHPRKFHLAGTGQFLDEFASFDLYPYAPYATVHCSLRDWNTLRLYARWIYHFDHQDLVSVTPALP